MNDVTTVSPTRLGIVGEPDDPALAALFARLRLAGTEPKTLHRAFALSPAIFEGMYTLAVTLRFQSTVSRQLFELIALLTTLRENGKWEYYMHERIALQVCLTPEHISSVANWRDAEIYSADERAVLAYVDALSERKLVPDDVFDKLREFFTDEQIVEITLIAGIYTAASRFSSGMAMQPGR